MFIKWVTWDNSQNSSVLSYAKLDNDLYDVEKFEFFKDRTWSYTTSTKDEGRIRLGDQPFSFIEKNNDVSKEKNHPLWFWEITEEEYYAARKKHIDLNIPKEGIVSS